MSKRTVTVIVEWRCDNCGATAVLESGRKPEGWGVVTEKIGPCGLTNYYYDATRDACTSCLASKVSP
jgi:hypothetical protein